jgi:predicted dehydrogenase
MRHVLLLDMAIHTFDAARLITGSAHGITSGDPVAVYCREWNPRGSWYDHDASAVAIFDMTGDVVYTYRGSWCAEGLNTTWESDWRIIGTEGSVRWDGGEGLTAEVVEERGGFRSKLRPVEVPTPDRAGKIGGHAGCIADFVRCIREGDTPETICTDNVKSLAMVFGAIESAERGQRIVILQEPE